MKKLILLLTICLTALFQARADNEEVTTDTTRLPVAARQFIHKHFPTGTISRIKIESNMMGVSSYDVTHSNGCELEFDKEGQWTEIDGNGIALPAHIIPDKIMKYADKHFPEQKITVLERTAKGYEAKLSNGMELLFDKKHKFLHLDR